MNDLDDTELRRLVHEASEALLNLNHAIHRRSVSLPHGEIDKLAAKATDAHARMILALNEHPLAARMK